MTNSTSKVPRPNYGKRRSRGTSTRGARAIRRAVMARARNGTGHQFVMVTLTTQAMRSDEEMHAARERFLAWGRKYLGQRFGWYVWAAELQARGVLHFHLLLDQRIPRGLFLRMRQLWAETYGMGVGSVDIKPIAFPKRAAKYLTKYLAKRPNAYRLGLDGEGMITSEPWQRNAKTGRMYERVEFGGNVYGMSKAARYGTRPVFEFAPIEGAFPRLEGWHGCVLFFDSLDEAMGFVLEHVNGSS